MILKSLRDNAEYFWIKVPRTATQAFSELFTQYTSKEPVVLDGEHAHFSYMQLCDMYQQHLPAITVVRHPVSRFKSIVYYLAGKHATTTTDVKLLWESTDSCVDFLNKTFSRNCHLIETAPLSQLLLDTRDYQSTKNFIGASNAFFKTQAEYAYHPKVKIFPYEQLNTFIEWVDVALGYDTSRLTTQNASNTSINMPVDFTHPELVKTVENMYYIDYKVFGYPLQYSL
jgi:hypothetical protein